MEIMKNIENDQQDINQEQGICDENLISMIPDEYCLDPLANDF